MKDYDVAIIGGGLLGSAFAWGLANRGLNSVVFCAPERRKPPGQQYLAIDEERFDAIGSLLDADGPMPEFRFKVVLPQIRWLQHVGIHIHHQRLCPGHVPLPFTG